MILRNDAMDNECFRMLHHLVPYATMHATLRRKAYNSH